jgi:hypothetical protein
MEKNTASANRQLTRAEVALAAVRFYDSFEPEAEYVKIDDIGTTVIKSSEIKNAKSVPSVGENGCSDEWRGFVKQNYGDVGKNNKLQCIDNLTYNYREADFAEMAELGVNYVRLQFRCYALAYPDFSEDRSEINQNILEDIDNAVRWGLKYGLHISLCFENFPDADLYGTPESPAFVLSDESFELKAKLMKAMAQRYRNVPADYISFELENEFNPLAPEENPVRTSQETVEQYIMIAKEIKSVRTDMSVSISTDLPLTDDNRQYWEMFAEAGVNLDYHCYEPRSFVAPDSGRCVKASKMVWPNYVDENGVSWDMEKVYQTYVKPYKDLADEYGVGFRIGECGIFVGDSSIDVTYTRKAVQAWAKEFATVMQKHKISYVLTGTQTRVMQDTKTIQLYDSVKFEAVTVHLDDYDCSFYVNKELAKALFGKK